jgi:hypothetical protein
MKRSTIRLFLWAALLAMLSCHRPPKPATETADRAARAALAAEASESTRRHWAYLDRIRQADSLNSSIDRTLLSDQHELGVVLFSSVTPETVPPLMSAVMKEMAQKFPKEDVTLSVYAASTPPHKIGTAHLNGQTGETTYTPVR